MYHISWHILKYIYHWYKYIIILHDYIIALLYTDTVIHILIIDNNALMTIAIYKTLSVINAVLVKFQGRYWRCNTKYILTTNKK